VAITPLVYIIVLTWNGREDTLACLASLASITYANARVLLVDNASTDGTVEAVRSRYPAVELLVNPENYRFSGGNNRGIELAMKRGARYILLLNNDTVVKEDFLDRLVEGAEDDPAIGMASPKILYHADPGRIWYAGAWLCWWMGSYAHKGVREEDRGQYDLPGRTDLITGCCALVRREVVESVGMFDEAYFIYGEDVDWSVRASRARFAIQYVPSAVIWHKVSVSTGGHLSWFKNWNKLKSQLRVMARYAKPYHWLTILIFLPFHVIVSYLRLKADARRRAQERTRQ
jgi:GT2 family glycosyltransferase